MTPDVCLEQLDPEEDFILETKCSSSIGIELANFTIGNPHFDIDLHPVQTVRRFLAPLVGVSATAFLLFALGLVADVFRKTQRHNRNHLVILCAITTVMYM